MVAVQEAAILSSGAPCFLLLLQLNSDKQILVHSRFRDMRHFMETVVASFAAHAPAGTMLVVKAHPLDNGEVDHGRDLTEIAARHGVAGRCVLLDGGNLIPLLERSRGAITINSTAGISAMHRAVPLIVLGQALFDMPGLTHQGPLDSFWQAPQQGDRRLYRAWRRVIGYRCQINGNFYSRRGMRLALPACLERLTGERPVYMAAAPSEGEPDSGNEPPDREVPDVSRRFGPAK
jgi:capsular polysaccharide export protein